MHLESRHRLSLLTLGFVFLLGLHPPMAFSTEACAPTRPDRPVSESGDESGIGGTGIQDARPDRLSAPGDDSESGIGGTGIYGTVTNLDRLCVNGLEISVPDQVLAQTSSGEPNDGTLALGMVVWIRATQSEEGLVAEQIRIDPGLVGVVESVASGGQEFVISGQTVLQPNEVMRGPGIAVESPVTGQWLVVYGLRDAHGLLIASRIEVDHERKSRGSNGTLARWLTESGPLRSLSIEGYVAGSPERPRLAGLELEFPASHPGHERESLRPGLRITAEGRISKEGVFQIERSTTLDRPRPALPIDRESPAPPEIERNSRRPQKPPMPPRIDRPRMSRPSIDRPTRSDVQRRR